MAGMVIQHNLNAINANNKLAVNIQGTKKATEKLSSGFRINRAADDAAGLAISEKMRAQLKGLGQAIRNANDGISLIQTAEGALDETHNMLKRLKELSVQAGNGTYTDEERKYMQMEIDSIKTEIDRISIATDFNGIKLLDGSLGGGGTTANGFGALYGSINTTTTHNLFGSTVESNIAGVTVVFDTAKASGIGAEWAEWDEDGTTLTIELAPNAAYTQAQIDELIANASREKVVNAAPADVKVTLANGFISSSGTIGTFGATVAGVTATSEWVNMTDFGVATNATLNSADTIRFVSNSYGVDSRVITIATVAAGGSGAVRPGNEYVETTTADTTQFQKDGEFTIYLATGYAYSASEIENILRKAGLDYTVQLDDIDTPQAAPNRDMKITLFDNATADVDMASGTAGAGVGKDFLGHAGEGITFQIGANNATEQRVTLNINDMGSGAIGVSNINVSTVTAAQRAMSSVEGAIVKVSEQRASLGAMQNRLEYTVNSLTTTHENLTAAESQIRDTDMAMEMVEYTKFNILQQAAQAMLAQANQAPQAILQLLR